MKQGSFKAVCLIFWVCIVVFSAFGDEYTNNWETKILESFNGDSDYVWKTDASKFTTQTDDVSYPLLAFVDSWPIAAFGANRDGSQVLKSLGIHGRFDRRGYNWIDVYPTKKSDDDSKESDKPYEIPIPGRVNILDMWVWGANLNYYIEVYLRDYQGVVHTVKLGDIAHQGWKNLRVALPRNIPQGKRILPKLASLSFVKFRIWTQPVEKVGDFYIYFKQFKALTDVFEQYFDGSDLADPAYVQELWTSASEGEKK